MRAFIPTVLLLSAACSALHVPPPPPQAAGTTGRTISRAEAIEDLDTLMATYQRVHPDLFFVRSRDQVSADRARIVAELPQTMSRTEWWLRLAPFVAQFRDGHTSVSMPGEEIESGPLAREPRFPPSVVVGPDGSLVVSAGFSQGIRRGDRLLRVNGLDADSLLAAWTELFSGETVPFRRASAVFFFRSLVAMHGIAAPYQIVVMSAGDTAPRTVVSPGISPDSFAVILRRANGQRVAPAAAQGAPQAAAMRTANFSYRLLRPGVGYMDFRSMEGDVGVFRREVAAMFRRVALDSVRTLVVDLRNNGGGDSRLGDALLDHVTTTPYRMNSRKDWRMSADYRRYLESTLPAPARVLHLWDLVPTGRKMFRGPEGEIVTFNFEETVPERAEPAFAGRTCVLIGPGTFSSASDMADGIKTYHLATIVGEETGGRVNSFGEIYQFRLPRSSLMASVSSAHFIGAAGDTATTHGVIPDLPVLTTPADVRAGRDPALERAAECGGG